MLYELDKGIFLRNLTSNIQLFLIVFGFLAITIANLEQESFAQSSEPMTIEANLDSEFLLQVNQSAEIKSEDMKITFLNVTSDSRCPSDVTCIWQGQAGIELDVQKGEVESTVSLSIGGDSSPEESIFNSYLIQLVDLSPYPISTKNIQPEDYTVTIKITKYEELQNEETSILPPLKQVKLGVEISCKPELILITKYDGSPACVKPETREKLIERGWALEDTNQNEPTTITQENNNQTIELNVGDTFLLKLGEEHIWNVEIDNDDVVSRVKNIAVIRGAQGVYEAKMPGSATLSAVGDLPCREEVPPCAAPTILFKIQINVS
ncbi:MAG: hypothetical protein XU09_C0006G0255 [Thaumarchaeota archaeon CSP1-1]|nr:MAG: hypothetical protein XU09_C0006G0255 [Thaumarchaeota archaeon CSP1-1]